MTKVTPVLMGNCPSSGSTLLRTLLNRHPEIVSGPELSVFSHPAVWSLQGESWRKALKQGLAQTEINSTTWKLESGFVPYALMFYKENIDWYGFDLDSLAELIDQCDDGRTFFDAVLASKTTPATTICIEKSPPNIYAVPHFLQQNPHGKAIVIVRDGRDTICSLMDRNFSFFEAASTWLVETSIAYNLANRSKKKDRAVHLLRYEDLLRNYAHEMQAMLDFLECDSSEKQITELLVSDKNEQTFDNKFISTWKHKPSEPLNDNSIGRWKRELEQRYISIFNRLKINFPASSILADYLTDGMTSGDLMKVLKYEFNDELLVGLPELLKVCATEVDCLSDQKTGCRNLHRSAVAFDFDKAPFNEKVDIPLVLKTLLHGHAHRNEEIVGLTDKLTRTEVAANEIEKRRAEVEQQLSQRDQEIVGLTDKLTRSEVAANEIEKRRAEVEQQLSQRDQEIVGLTDKLTRSEVAANEIEKRRAEVEQQLSQRDQEIVGLTDKLTRTEVAANEIEKRRAEVEQQLSQRDQEIVGLTDKLTRSEVAANEIEKRRAEVEQQLSQRDQEIVGLTDKLTRSEVAANEIEKRRAEVEQQLSQRDQEIVGFTEKLNANVMKLSIMDNRLNDAIGLVNRLKSNRDILARIPQRNLDQVAALADQLQTVNNLANELEAKRAKLEEMLTHRDKAIAELQDRLALKNSSES